jgi:hypothetical protein
MPNWPRRSRPSRSDVTAKRRLETGGAAVVQTSSRRDHRASAAAGGRDDGRHHETEGMAAAHGARLLGRSRTQDAGVAPGLGEGRRLPERLARWTFAEGGEGEQESDPLHRKRLFLKASDHLRVILFYALRACGFTVSVSVVRSTALPPMLGGQLCYRLAADVPS